MKHARLHRTIYEVEGSGDSAASREFTLPPNATIVSVDWDYETVTVTYLVVQHVL